MSKDLHKKSKYMSLLLRHDPSKESLSMDDNGWVSSVELMKKLFLTEGDMEWIINNNGKKRFELSANGLHIRAQQGHSDSLNVDLQLKPTEPPFQLYHGTSKETISRIERSGAILRMSRQHVHLSADTNIAMSVGKRHGSATILVINSGDMHKNGFEFFLSGNNVWLTREVPIEYIIFNYF